MQKKELVIGLDFGSDSVRALLARCEDGAELATSVYEYPRWKAGLGCDALRQQFRQHPLDYLEGIEHTVNAVLENQDRSLVAGIGVDTTGSTVAAVDAHGVPLAMHPGFEEDPNAMFILWKDHTALTESLELTAAAHKADPDYTSYEGGIYSSEWFWSKLLYTLRKSPAAVRKAASWMECCDWITGNLAGCTDVRAFPRGRCAAGHKAMFHPDWNGLPPETFLAGVDPLLGGWREKLYDKTRTADQAVGTLGAEWAEKLGLSRQVVIAGGAIDCHAGAVGVAIRPGELVKVVGTSTCDLMVAPTLKKKIPGICGQVDGSIRPDMTGLEAGQSAFGDIYAWLKRLLEWNGSGVNLSDLEKEATKVPPGANGILTLDWFNGRRSPDANEKLTGLICGLHLGSTAPMLFRSLIESTAFGSRAIMERFVREGIPFESVTAVGGIAQKSPLVMQLLADILNRPIRVAKSAQICALGAAMYAAAAAKVYPDLLTAMEKMNSGIDAVYTPDSVRAETYNAVYRKYAEMGILYEKAVMKEPSV
ncbi:MAG: Ribulokinase [Lentisphaerae bacterium ADurb.Bin242]|nr:MAG: Ribulokinase [Lentisphaerae bacterium ADurb.Bin242]